MIAPIGREEWVSVKAKGGWRTAPSAEGRALLAVPSAEGKRLIEAPFGTGLKMTCRWNHSGRARTCPGGVMLHKLCSRHGFRISIRCRDKTLYVWKLEKEDRDGECDHSKRGVQARASVHRGC